MVHLVMRQHSQHVTYQNAARVFNRLIIECTEDGKWGDSYDVTVPHACWAAWLMSTRLFSGHHEKYAFFL
jgi:hypothetical protein